MVASQPTISYAGKHVGVVGKQESDPLPARHRRRFYDGGVTSWQRSAVEPACNDHAGRARIERGECAPERGPDLDRGLNVDLDAGERPPALFARLLNGGGPSRVEPNERPCSFVLTLM